MTLQAGVTTLCHLVTPLALSTGIIPIKTSQHGAGGANCLTGAAAGAGADVWSVQVTLLIGGKAAYL